MKIRSLSKLALFFTVAAALTFTSVSAHPRSCHHRIIRAVERTIEYQSSVYGVKGSFHDVYSLLNQEYAYLGATSNPNPVTNGLVSGLLIATHDHANEAITRFGNDLRDLGFTNNQVELLETEFTAYFIAASNYARIMNLYNVFGELPSQEGLDPAIGALTGTQDQAAAALLTAATAFGTTLAELTFRPYIGGQLTSTATLLTEAAQAYRGVLADSNVFGANPGVPATETSAAVRIFNIIHELVAAGV